MFSIRCARGHAAEQNNDPVWMQGTGRDRVHAFRLLPTHSYNATLKGNQSKDGARLLLMGSLSGMKKQTYTTCSLDYWSRLLLCCCIAFVLYIYIYIYRTLINSLLIVQELCESRGGRPGLSVLTSLLVSVDVKIYWTVLRHWSELVPNMSNDIWGH